MIYLDYSANTPVDERVLDIFCETERKLIGNANSKHIAGDASKNMQDEINKSIADLFHIDEDEIIYTSGATESNNLAIRGIAHTMRHVGRHIITTPLEHSSVSAPLTALQEAGYEVDMVKIGTDGKVDISNLRSLMRKDTVLVTVCAVDSELGTIQPVREIREILKDYPNCLLHVDATQAVGKIDVDFSLADTVSLAAHKFYGIIGSGMLYKKKGLVIEPVIYGGASTTIYRSGTPTVSLNKSLEIALSLALKSQTERYDIVSGYNRYLRETFAKYPLVTVNSPDNTIPHILNISVKGVKGSVFQKALNEKGVCVSVKSACSTDNLPSRAVFAVSKNRKNALSSWRISLSHMTTEEELHEFINIFDECYNELTKSS
ncbi:MAG: cysteine desulfurase [Lachnospiraceae bacterium]|nr:cysteine desulfurase [Lachnospiraceae bacterium]MBQ9233155.1 cysteine desulfurase [Lachnospiraceae bacterium]